MLLFLYFLLSAVGKLKYSTRAEILSSSNYVSGTYRFSAGLSLRKAIFLISLNLQRRITDGTRGIFCPPIGKDSNTTMPAIQQNTLLFPFTQVWSGSIQMASNVKASRQQIAISKYRFGKQAVIQLKKRVGVLASLSFILQYQSLVDIKYSWFF